jgi:acyl-CoA synthetase (AMP-forming)/AMP-acid ligase II
MTALHLESAETIAAALAMRSRIEPGRLALAVARRGKRAYDEVSLAELERDACTFAQVFAHHGIGRGMRTAVMIPPGREFCAAVFALMKVGAVPVFVDPGIGLTSVGHCFRQTRPEAFVGIRKAQVARRMFGWGRGSIRISVTVEPVRRGGAEDAVVDFDSRPAEATAEIAAIAFTSGSTGPPKGVVLDHRNLLAQADLVRDLLGPYAEGPHLATFPLFLLFAPVLGIAAVLPEVDTSRPASADPARLIAAAGDYSCQSAFASPVLVRKLGAYCRETGARFASLVRMLSGGAPSDPDALADLARAMAPGGEVFTPYGATEALPVSNLGSREILAETREKTRRGAGVCVGRPVRGISVRIIPISDAPFSDASEVPAFPAGETGEIAVSGAVVSRAYCDNPAADRAAKIPCGDGGFYHRMGDLGYFDAEGRLWMCGRKSQRVVTRGHVYFTVPCEGVFNAHPEVARTALVAAGSRPVLCVETVGSKSSREKKRITSELQAFGAACEQTREIRDFLFHRSFPVDARHNSKIRREQLSQWATRKTRVEEQEP